MYTPHLPRAVLAAALFSSTAVAFYIPGVAPNSYNKGDLVPLNVNHLTPAATVSDDRIRSVFSFDYYRPELHFCRPKEGPQSVPESLGSILFGDRIQTSPFELRLGVNETCKKLCDPVLFDPDSAIFANALIDKGYNFNFLIDGLPAGQDYKDATTQAQYVMPGFPLGSKENAEDGSLNYYVNNHLDIRVRYHEVVSVTPGVKSTFRVVGATVHPTSRTNTLVIGGEDEGECGDEYSPVQLSELEDTHLTWTYSVSWIPSDTAWATRWDTLLHVYNSEIQWLALVCVTGLVIVFSTSAIGILTRALKKDIARYNRLDQFELSDMGNGALEDGVQEDSGWKLVHGDVFRNPRYPLLLSVLLGSGVQLFVMTALTIVFALFGFLSPSYRGMLATVMLIMYTFFGFIGGYVSSRVYKTFNGEAWKRNIILTPLLVPGVVYCIFFLLNLLLWFNKASGAVPFGTLLAIVVIWFIISVPLSFAGSWIGFKSEAIQPPVRTNQIPRQIPPSASYYNPVVSTLAAGIPTFFVMFTELFYIMQSIWFNMFFYMFGFLFLTFILSSVMTAAVTVISTYLLLCTENYRWQWRAYFAAGASAAFVVANAFLYAITSLRLSTWSGLGLYLGYSILIGFLSFIMTGAVGFFAAWWFVHKIYASIKVD